MAIGGFGWTDERVERLKTLWGEGLSCSQIAKDLKGVSRNAVIGKVCRLGLAGRKAASAPKLRAPPSPKPVRSIAVRAAQFQPAMMDNIKARESYVEPAQDLQPLPIEEHHRHACCWPIGSPGQPDFASCGREQEMRSDGRRRPYCAPHHAASVNPNQSRSRSNTSLATWVDRIETRHTPRARAPDDDEPRALYL